MLVSELLSLVDKNDKLRVIYKSEQGLMDLIKVVPQGLLEHGVNFSIVIPTYSHMPNYLKYIVMNEILPQLSSLYPLTSVDVNVSRKINHLYVEQAALETLIKTDFGSAYRYGKCLLNQDTMGMKDKLKQDTLAYISHMSSDRLSSALQDHLKIAPSALIRNAVASCTNTITEMDFMAKRFAIAVDTYLDGRDVFEGLSNFNDNDLHACLLYTSPSPRDRTRSRMPSSA